MTTPQQYKERIHYVPANDDTLTLEHWLVLDKNQTPLALV